MPLAAEALRTRPETSMQPSLVVVSYAGDAPQTQRSTDLVAAQTKFAAELRRQRQDSAKMSQRDVGAATFVSREWVTKVEAGAGWPDRRFAKRADALLGCGGTLLKLWEAGDVELADQRRSRSVAQRVQQLTASAQASGDKSARQVLDAAASDPSEVAPEVVLAALEALGRVVAERIDGVETVRQVAELEQRLVTYQAGGIEVSGTAQLGRIGLDIADTSRLLDRVRDDRLRLRVARLAVRLTRLLVDRMAELGDATVVSLWTALAQRVDTQLQDLCGETPEHLAQQVNEPPVESTTAPSHRDPVLVTVGGRSARNSSLASTSRRAQHRTSTFAHVASSATNAPPASPRCATRLRVEGRRRRRDVGQRSAVARGP